MLRNLLVVVGFLTLGIDTTNASLSISLAWDPSPDTNVVGYALYYGNSPSSYTARVDVGDQTTATVAALTAGEKYYFAVTAYAADGTESLPSNWVAYLVPGALRVSMDPDGRCVRLWFVGVPGRLYEVQASEDLVSWTDFCTLESLVNDWIEVLDPAAANLAKRFYRVRQI
jgi:hypothetical protein